MDMSMHIEPLNLVKSLQGTYRQEDKEMLLELVREYKEKNNCSYKYAYEKMVEGNPSYATFTAWKRKAEAQS